MGVLGLWQLLSPVGQPVALESLENKIFAVDISIWLNQAVKGYRDAEGGSVANAHLLSLFSRLCKLLFYKIRPIIVFDGGFPELKKQTIINRQQRRAAVKQASKDIGLKILTNYLASQNLALLRGEGSPKKTLIKPKEKARDELFILPPLPNSSQSDGGFATEDNIDSVDWKFTNFSKEDIRYLNQIDLESDDFNNLPPDVKQEILATLKESRKHRSWDQYNELPEDSNDFSSYQMKCLLKKRVLSQKLEQVQKDLRQINTADFVSQYTNDHVIGETNKIMSDDCSHYVLLKKIIHKSDASDKISEDSEMNSSMKETKNAFITDMENIDVCDIPRVDMKTNSSCDLNVKTEIESDTSLNSDIEEDVDNPPKAEFCQVIEKNIDNPPEADFQVAKKDVDNPPKADFHQIIKKDDSYKERRPKLDVSKDDVILSSDDEGIENKLDSNLICNEAELKTANICEVVENMHKSDNPSELKIVEEVSLPVDDNVTTSEDELIPCEEAEIADYHFEDLVSENAVKPGVPNVKSTDSQIGLKGIKINSETDFELSSKDTTFEAVPSTSYATPFSHDALAKSPTSFDQPLSEETKAELVAKNLQMQADLEVATALLEADRAKQDRQSNTVQEHMVEECKELLRLFGIPFIVSPTEAEAQCAFYDSVDITHGTITDDSDVWLFGGKRVYKNFFTQQKYVEFFKDNEIFNHFGLSRTKLINFALLTGSDYTEGIEGVGPVTAMEILSEFPGEGIEVLIKFKEWWQLSNKHARPPENKVRAKFLKLVLGEKFPEDKIVDAYLNPEIDDSTEKFTWGRPDLDALRDYARERFGWNKSKVDESLLPVIKKLSERDSQTHIDNFFTVNLKKQKDLFPSKRIMSALKKMTSPQKNSSGEKSVSKMSKRKIKTDGKNTVPKKKGRKCDKPVRKTASKSKPQAPVLSEESSDES